jgi:type IV pilus assembly protein PilM
MAVDLAERRGLTLEHSRAWLTHVGLNADVDFIDGDVDIVTEARDVLTDGVRRIAGEVRASLDFHHGQAGGGAVVEHVILTGPALEVAGFDASLSNELGLPVEPRTVPSTTDGIDLARVSVAAGLAVEEVPA